MLGLGEEKGASVFNQTKDLWIWAGCWVMNLFMEQLDLLSLGNISGSLIKVAQLRTVQDESEMEWESYEIVKYYLLLS